MGGRQRALCPLLPLPSLLLVQFFLSWQINSSAPEMVVFPSSGFWAFVDAVAAVVGWVEVDEHLFLFFLSPPFCRFNSDCSGCNFCPNDDSVPIVWLLFVPKNPLCCYLVMLVCSVLGGRCLPSLLLVHFCWWMQCHPEYDRLPSCGTVSSQKFPFVGICCKPVRPLLGGWWTMSSSSLSFHLLSLPLVQF